MSDRQARLEALRRQYAAELAVRFAEMRRLQQSMEGDSAEDAGRQLSAWAHNLAGSAGVFGFERVGSLALELSRCSAAGPGRVDSLEPLMTRLAEAVAEAVTEGGSGGTGAG